MLYVIKKTKIYERTKNEKNSTKRPKKTPRFTYSVCGPFTKNSEIYANMEYRLYLQEWPWLIKHDMAYGKSKDFTKRREIEKVSQDKAFKTVSNPKCDGY